MASPDWQCGREVDHLKGGSSAGVESEPTKLYMCAEDAALALAP